ncbi:acetylneuraminic acid synthetase [Hyunsoonleella flava]|uniref:Acetylneuraminic acid synthetase n=1 Tax=Hyunsoonleella flava TaxID=2527939 RepID=A0A4Q9FGW7_9FLAO|nr:N-acetylneuraminate synthase family protein [Hyunsoonleella flava]TBN00186.1 acetylneuraminic acid synthetase [Hyunsoonleella flava]
MKIKDLLIDYNFIKKGYKEPYIIAEAGVNHEGSMDLAKRLIDEAKEGGAHAIKFQTYKANTIASRDSPSYWDTTKESTTSQFELFQKYDNFWKSEYEQLKDYCDEVEIEFLSTPFDAESAHFLNEMMDVFKVSSSDITNLPFLELICSFGKPIILSTGASYLWEVQQALETINKYNLPVCLMHCILNYPTLNENANLGMIADLIEKFPNTIPGYSDHTLPEDMETIKIASLLGAVVIEKHFTHDKTLPGNDHYHAMDKEDLKLFFQKINRVTELIGAKDKTSLPSEEKSRLNARRSLVALEKIEKGQIVSEDVLTWKRPAKGISPKNINDLIGKKATVVIHEDTVLQWKMFD